MPAPAIVPSRVMAVAARSLAVLCATALLFGGGCSNIPGLGGLDGKLPAQETLIPNTTVNITESFAYPLDKLVYWTAYAAAAYLILDPLAPNWDIEQAAFPDGYYHFSMKMKRIYAGGAGEAREVFHRRARDLKLEGGYDSYQVVEYTEGMESSVLGSRRVAHGVIHLVRK